MRDIARITEMLFRKKYRVFALLSGSAFLMHLVFSVLQIFRFDPGWFGLIFVSIYQLVGFSLLLDEEAPRSPFVRIKTFGVFLAANLASQFLFLINVILLLTVYNQFVFSYKPAWLRIVLPICVAGLWVFYLRALPFLSALKIRSLQAPNGLVAPIKLIRNSSTLRQVFPPALLLLTTPVCLTLFIPLVPAFLIWKSASYAVEVISFQKLLLSVGCALALFIEVAVASSIVPRIDLIKNMSRMSSRE